MSTPENLRKLAVLLGIVVFTSRNGVVFARNWFRENVKPREYPWNPYSDRAQAMMLQEQCRMSVNPTGNRWVAKCFYGEQENSIVECEGEGEDPRAAICACGLKLMEARTAAG